MKELKPLLDANMRSAVGATVMLVRSEGKWRRARNEAELLAHLEDDSGYEIQTIDPEPRILNATLDRVMGKAAQSFELPTGSGIGSVEVTYKIISTPDA